MQNEDSDQLIFSMDDFNDESTGDVMVGNTPFGDSAGAESVAVPGPSDESCYTNTCTYAECCDREETQVQ